MAFAAVNSPANNKAFPKIDFSTIDEAFAANISLRKRVYDAINATPQHGTLFEDIAKYACSLGSKSNTTLSALIVDEGPATKKRKLQNGGTQRSSAPPAGLAADAPLHFYIQDMSFSIPQRKKLRLEVTSAGGYLRAKNQASGEVEFGLAMAKIQHVICLPVPEKSQRLFSFCVIPEYGNGITAPPDEETVPESMVWTIADGPPKMAHSGTSLELNEDHEETTEQLIRRMLNETLPNTPVICPDQREFVSAMPEAHRKGEKAYHIKAFRGSKEGYLFFLSTGIFFGFKKPLLFFAFENIESISYTSVLQRTFNLNITVQSTTGAATQEFEFSMIDQADYSGIDTYVRKHSLQDASLAEARRAKKPKVNGAGDQATEDVDVEQESELQRAQRELEDQEDEDEEDYDPGSEEESEGSETSSEDEIRAPGDGDLEGRNLVEEELGSEAEDVLPEA